MPAFLIYLFVLIVLVVVGVIVSTRVFRYANMEQKSEPPDLDTVHYS